MELRKYVAKGNIEKLGDRKYRVAISDETKDRHGTVIKADGWMFENFLRNPIITYMHDAMSNDPDSIIGKGLAVWTDENRTTWMDFELEPEGDNPIADKVAKKLDFGSHRAVSVGFNPFSWSKGDRSVGEDVDTLYFRKQDLLELAVAKLPSNPNATPSRSFEADLEDFVKMAIQEEQAPKQEEQETKAAPDEHTGRFLKLRVNTL